MELSLKTFWIVAILLASDLVSPIVALDPDTEAAISKLITEEFMPSNHNPGLGLSILKDGVVPDSMVRGYGFANLEDQIPANPSTLFSIGSISKGFVGILVVKILSEKFPELGESALDVPIRKLIPAANYTLIDRFRSESASFRDLMGHRLCTEPESMGLTAAPYKDKHEFFYRQRYAPEVCSMRTGFVYNNGAVGQAGEFIAQLAGRTIEDLLTELFLDLGMTETTYVQEDVNYDLKTNMSRSYYRNGTETMKFNNELLKRVCYALGSGGILSTANDMLKYTSFHLRNGKVGDNQVVSEEAMSWLRMPTNVVPALQYRTSESEVAFGDFAYGIGLNIGTYDGYERISHAGYLAPYSSYFTFFPALNIGIFTAVNGPGALIGLDEEYLHAQIFNILMYGRKNPALPALFKKAQASKKVPKPNTVKGQPAPGVSLPKLDSRQLAGVYGNGQSGEFTIFASSTSDDLYLRYGRWGTGFLRPVTNTIYSVDSDSDLIQEEYAGGGVGYITVDFTEPDTAKIALFPGAPAVVYIKGLTLDKLPAQPWLPDSCGPAEPINTK